MYPSFALGVRTDVDTFELGIRELSRSVTAVDLPADDPAARDRLAGVVDEGLAIARHWHALATSTSVSAAEKRHGVVRAARYVDSLVRAGATACARLQPATG